jgi:hypothetical protein
MGMRRRKESRDQELWIVTDKLARAPGHVFYRKLNHPRKGDILLFC